MTAKAPTIPDPQQRAEQAAEQLASEGNTVSARLVRERASVAMAVAVDVARVWNDKAAQEVAVPEPPEAVRVRFDAVWRALYTIAREELSIERDALKSRLDAAEAELVAFTKDLTESEARTMQVESERDEALDAARAESETLRARVTVLEADLSEATKARNAAEGLTAGLREALAALKPTAD